MNTNISKNLTKIVAILAISSLSTLGFAEDEQKQKEQRSSTNTPRAHSKEGFMMKYDENGDGTVSKDEFLAARIVSHKEKDLNGDGVVTEAEYVAEWEVRLDKQLAERREASVKQAYVRYGVLDKDDNEDISIDEFHASGDRTFSHYDTNGDGMVTASEEMPENRFGDVAQAASEQQEKKNKKSKKKKKKSKSS